MARTIWGFVFIIAVIAAVTFSSSPTNASSLQSSAGSAVNAPVAGVPLAPVADTVQLDDLITQGSICAGLDCVNGEAFVFDTIRLKENNLRIHFDDTSTSASFPSNDWRIVINETSNFGLNFFGIEDATAGHMPFLIEAGAQASALYVEADNDVGIGTSEPATRLHLNDDDTPTLRLGQDNSAGWGAQDWDIGANEEHFFVRDVTSDTIPIQVSVGAADNTLFVGTNGSVGIGTTTPTATLHIEGDVHVTGNLTQASDRNLKENIVAANNQEILDQLAEIPIYYWNYTADSDDTTHLGPMAQDFHASSRLGSETTISNLDINGALIASVQALNTELEHKTAEIEALEAENADLQERLEVLEAAVAQILVDQEKTDSEE